MRSEHNSILEVPTPDPLGVYVPAPDPIGVKRYLRTACFKILHTRKPSRIQYVGPLPGADIMIVNLTLLENYL